MDCRRRLFSQHAMQRLFVRRIPPRDVRQVVEHGQVIEETVGDDGRRAWLLLGFPQGAPLHVVVSRDPKPDDCNVVTAYYPSAFQWDESFKRRRQ